MSAGRLTEAAALALSTNPNVKEVREGRVYLTYEFRVKLYEAWVEEPKPGTVRKVLRANGFDNEALGRYYACDICKTFMRRGHPTTGSGVQSRGQGELSREVTEKILLSTGKFRQKKNGIGFDESFIDELGAKYPGISIEDGIRAAGIDPALVGYQRIYQLEKRLSGNKIRMHARKAIYIAEEMQILKSHPYVRKASEKQIIFQQDLFAECKVLIENKYVMEAILKIYELPDTILRGGCRNNIIFRIRNAGRFSCKERRIIWAELTPEQQACYLRIQSKRLQALTEIAQKNLSVLREHFHGMTATKKLAVCQWFRDCVPKERNGRYSLRGMLQAIGISKSFYYKALSDGTYECRAYQQEARRREEMDIVRQVVE